MSTYGHHRGTEVDESQRRGLTEDVRHSTGAFELVLSPVLLALIGFGLDSWLGTVPVITVICAVVGFSGAAISLYYRYQLQMAEHEAGAPWAKR